MKIHRFIVNFDPHDEVIEITDEEMVTQISKILRLRVGEKLWLFDGKQTEILGVINAISKSSVEVAVEEVVKNTNEPEVKVTLYCAILKKENFELVVQKATEVGVAEIVPIISRRTVKLSLKYDRLEKIIREAAEQSGRGIIPLLHQQKTFAEALAYAQHNDRNMFCEKSDDTPLIQRCINGGSPQGRVGVFIGPEGGWTEDEVAMAKNNTFAMVNLGKLTLRSETAAIVASYLAITLKEI